MENKPIKLTISDYYRMLLEFDSYIAGNNPTVQARSLLQNRLREKEGEINRRLEELAKAKRLTLDQLKDEILGNSDE